MASLGFGVAQDGTTGVRAGLVISDTPIATTSIDT